MQACPVNIETPSKLSRDPSNERQMRPPCLDWASCVIAPRALAIAIARHARTESWQVKALVDATPISGPASVGNAACDSRAMVDLASFARRPSDAKAAAKEAGEHTRVDIRATPTSG